MVLEHVDRRPRVAKQALDRLQERPERAAYAAEMGYRRTVVFAVALAVGASAIASADPVAPVSIAHLAATVEMRLHDEPGLYASAVEIADPRSPRYRQFLEPSQIAERYGAAQSDIALMRTYFTRYGITVDAVSAHRFTAHLSGSSEAFARALGTTIGRDRTPTGVVLRAAGPLRPGEPLPIDAIAFGVESAAAGSDDGGASPLPEGAAQKGLTPQQLAGVFHYREAHAAGNRGAGITIGVIGTGMVSLDDVARFRQTFALQGAGTVSISGVDGYGQATPAFYTTPPALTPPCTARLPACNAQSDSEPAIDAQTPLGLAPDAGVRFYLGYAPPAGPRRATIGGPAKFDELAQAVADNVADVLSLSFNLCEPYSEGRTFRVRADGTGPRFTGIGPRLFAAAAIQGQAVFVSSGDTGPNACIRPGGPSADDVAIGYPSSDANVVTVGGTNTPVDAAGRLNGPLTTWGFAQHRGLGGSGGGPSRYEPQPAFQHAAAIPSAFRTTPDIALNADPASGMAVIFNAQRVARGGTSVAAPEAASMWALVLGACKRSDQCTAAGSGTHPYRLGNPNPLLYGIYDNRSAYRTVFYDVVHGSNAQLPACFHLKTRVPPCPTAPRDRLDPGAQEAKPGYDMATGLGAPLADKLIAAVVGP